MDFEDYDVALFMLTSHMYHHPHLRYHHNWLIINCASIFIISKSLFFHGANIRCKTLAMGVVVTTKYIFFCDAKDIYYYVMVKSSITNP